MSGRSSIENCQKIIRKLSFRKQGSCGLVGLLLKTILTTPAAGGAELLRTQFSFLSTSEIVEIIEFGAELWMILKKMHQTACNRSQSSQNENDTIQNKGDGNNQMRS